MTIRLAAALSIFLVFAVEGKARADSSPAPALVSVCFTPPAGCGEKIVEAIESARTEIRVQAYQFTSRPIIEALAAAYGRGVDVQLILDRSNDRNGKSPTPGTIFMENLGVPVWIDWQPSIAHNKVMVIDRRLVVGGSFNDTASADKRNAENVTFIASDAVAAEFLANWERRRVASRQFVGD